MSDRDQVEAARPCDCGGCSRCLAAQGMDDGPCTECEGKGWLVMDNDGIECPGTFIERCDSCGEGPADDDAALALVCKLADEGDEDAIDALDLCTYSWAPEVQTAGDGEAWTRNGLRFESREKAKEWVHDRALRWSAVTATRVVATTEEPNK